MLSKADILNQRKSIIAIAQRHGASDVRLFGSYVRGDIGPDSDVDLLVRFEPGRSLMDYGMLVEELRKLLGVKVDVVSEGALRDPSDPFTQHLLREAEPI